MGSYDRPMRSKAPLGRCPTCQRTKVELRYFCDKGCAPQTGFDSLACLGEHNGKVHPRLREPEVGPEKKASE